MDSPLPWLLELVSLLPYRLYHSERPERLGFQLPISLGLDILAVQPNLLARRVASRLYALVVSTLLQILSVDEVFSANNH